MAPSISENGRILQNSEFRIVSTNQLWLNKNWKEIATSTVYPVSNVPAQ